MWLGGQRERRWIPGTGRTDRRTTVGTAGSASYLQRIGEVSDAWKGAGFEKRTHLVKKKQTAIKTLVHIPFNLNVQMYIFNLFFVILDPKLLCTI